MIKKLVFHFAFLIVYIASKGEALRCYQCISSGGSKTECDDGTTYEGRERECIARPTYGSPYQPYNSYQPYQQYQPYQVNSGVPDAAPGSYCIKAAGYSNGVYVTIRGCSREYLEQRDEFTFDGFRFRSGYLVSCNTELCNGSTLSKPNLVLVLVSVITLFSVFVKHSK